MLSQVPEKRELYKVCMYEIEIKSLLGSEERANELKRRLAQLFPALKKLPYHKQLNHYFNEPKDLRTVGKVIGPLLSKEKRERFSDLIANVKGGVSIRTRDADGKVSFVLKASVGDDTSANGVSRLEFEEPVKLTLKELDKKLLDVGLSYQAKWSREREEYRDKHIHITIDKNAGYGYLAEFEQILKDKEKLGEAKKELLELMDKLGVEELPQDRLERMFKHYNKHWEEYYGTDKVFVIE